MKHSSRSNSSLKSISYRTARYAAGALVLALGMSTVAIAGSADVTKERVARSAVAVQEAQRTIGTAEAGAVELQRAKQHQEAANNALAKKQMIEAERRAEQAQLSAELAVAKMQSAEARRGADEVIASTDTLRKEIERSRTQPVTR
jgi:hypothetical protein